MIFALGLLLQLLVLHQPLGAQEIYLKRIVHLSEYEFSLGEVATVVNPDMRKQRLLESLSLGLSPERLTLLPVRIIRARVEAGLDERVLFIGDRTGLIPPSALAEDETWFYEQLLRDLEGHLVRKEGRVEIELLTRPVVNALAEGPVKFELAGAQAALDYPAGAILVRYRPQGVPEQEKSFRVLLHHFLPVAKAGRDLKAGTLLSADELEFQEIDLAVQPGSYITAGDLDAPQRLHAAARRGSLIRSSQVSRVMAVRAGESVQVSFRAPGLLVGVEGRAVSSGIVGEFVEIRVAGSQRRFFGEITSLKEVIIELP
jgi:flagella basal body P-ring formation protein FlgA